MKLRTLFGYDFKSVRSLVSLWNDPQDYSALEISREYSKKCEVG